MPGEYLQIWKRPYGCISSGGSLTAPVQPSLVKPFHHWTISFQPPDEVLQEAYDVYFANQTCPLNERVRFDSLKWSDEAGYSFFAPPQVDTVYTKNPITQEVTMHTYPFPALPKFSVALSHPVALILHASTVIFRHNMLRNRSNLYRLQLLGCDCRTPPQFWCDARMKGALAFEEPTKNTSAKHKSLVDRDSRIKRRKRWMPDEKVLPVLGRTRLQTKRLLARKNQGL
ncbi:hypothetical protein CYLTODRAFT_415816 [Cylindrobasidium torrendii FP15055 ss-10]|uniref:Uncharacterized protein n=1 Tax=Cylindrobasidium torrendii FP15055 ss-10 TaxID=1314674 RepID=A0A0D7AUE9_9AGAR|nr:hypothetical protein CYLTODRAFT_415816 [Cylindrobasidium torrendii FP15055 ss-10]